MSISQTKEGQVCRIKDLNGDNRFLSRITSAGLTLGSRVETIPNKGKYPLLVFARDTMLAISRKEAGNIFVEVIA